VTTSTSGDSWPPPYSSMFAMERMLARNLCDARRTQGGRVRI
jgi:hypothetical protein